MKKLYNNWERVTPGSFATKKENYIIYLRHLFVYELVKSKLTANSICLELGSGEGYGTYLLSKTVKKITGIDISPELIKYAQKKYFNNSVSFILYDGNKIPFENEAFDAVVSFQTIEHIKNDVGCINEINRVLKPGGFLFITTPNRSTRKNLKKPWNRFHVREYDKDEFKNLLKDKFTIVNVRGIFGDQEIMEFESKRVATYARIARWDILGLRRLIPISKEMFLLDILNKILNKKVNDKDIQEKYTLKQFSLSDMDVEKSLDLMGICIK